MLAVRPNKLDAVISALPAGSWREHLSLEVTNLRRYLPSRSLLPNRCQPAPILLRVHLAMNNGLKLRVRAFLWALAVVVAFLAGVRFGQYRELTRGNGTTCFTPARRTIRIISSPGEIRQNIFIAPGG